MDFEKANKSTALASHIQFGNLELAMKNHDLRAERRVPVLHKAFLGSESTWFPCMIQDMSNQGFLILCNAEVKVGDILELKCELSPQRILQCKVEVRHYNDGYLGAKIVEVSEFGSMLCRVFIDEQVSLNGVK